MTTRKGFTDDGLPEHLLRWLEMSTRRFSNELRAMERPRAGARAGQRRALQMITANGARITTLAARAGITKQAAGELVDGLEREGLAVSERDPGDGRVRLVRRTARGDVVAEDAIASIAQVEAKLRRQVGSRRYDEMVRVLREISGAQPEH